MGGKGMGGKGMGGKAAGKGTPPRRARSSAWTSASADVLPHVD